MKLRNQLLTTLLALSCFAQSATAPSPEYKVTGSPTAPLTLELYTDFTCPYCASFYATVLPQIEQTYVKTGKLRLVHRDYLLGGTGEHQFGPLAATYANAAGQLGVYEVAAKQIFKTQSVWSANGDIAGQLIQVLPPGTMQKVRELVKDPEVNASIRVDMAQGNKEHLNQTPYLVFISKTKHEPAPGASLAFVTLKSYIDELLAAK